MKSLVLALAAWCAGQTQTLQPLPNLPPLQVGFEAPVSFSQPVAAASLELAPLATLSAARALSIDGRAPLHALAGLHAASEPTDPAGSFFDGSAPKRDDDPPSRTSGFLERQLAAFRVAVRSGREDIGAALQASETIDWSRPYLDERSYDRWLDMRRQKLFALESRLARVVETRIQAEIEEGDFSSARDAIEELETRHPDWSKRHTDRLAALKARLPAEDEKAEPKPPVREPQRLSELLAAYLGKGQFRQAEYVLQTLEKRHPAWADLNRPYLESVGAEILRGVYDAFEQKKKPFSPLEAVRLAEYVQALGQGSNRGFGFKKPVKQDPNAPMCTVISLCYAIEATMGFSNPEMTMTRFTDLVRSALGDPTIGSAKGLSTHRVRKFMKALGLPLKVIEMQDRMKRPFEEKELLALFQPNQFVIPVFIIAQKYADEKGLQREEHKGFLRDAYFSPSEQRWVYLMMDPLIGRMSFYTWPELQPFLHKLFVVKVDKPLQVPSDPSPK